MTRSYRVNVEDDDAAILLRSCRLDVLLSGNGTGHLQCPETFPPGEYAITFANGTKRRVEIRTARLGKVPGQLTVAPSSSEPLVPVGLAPDDGLR